MGIKPEGTNPVIVPPDDTQSRWGAWEVSIDTAGQQAGEVFAETHAIAESANTLATTHATMIGELIEDSAGIGDESKTINQQMRDLLDPDNESSELWTMQTQINELNNERNDLQDQMIELNAKAISSQAKHISRLVFIERDTPFEDEYFRVERVSGQPNKWRVTAKPGWIGHYTWQSSYYFSPGDSSPVIDGRTVNIDRQWDENAWNRNPSILQYQVKQGVAKFSDKDYGYYSSQRAVWYERPELKFQVPENNKFSIYYRVAWDATTRNGSYGFRVRNRNTGKVLMQWGPRNKIGPLFPHESGVRTFTLSEFDLPLTAGHIIAFETFSDEETDGQRAVQSSERKISWVS